MNTIHESLIFFLPVSTAKTKLATPAKSLPTCEGQMWVFGRWFSNRVKQEPWFRDTWGHLTSETS